MKKILIISFVIFLTFLKLTSYSQNVSISDIDRTPDASAILDLYSTNKGLLIPKVALLQTTNPLPISSPAVSLIIYNTASVLDVTPGFYYWNGAAWSKLGTSNYTFTNGLTESSGTIKLGGDLIESTTINQDGTENFSIINNGTGLTLFDLTNTGDFQIRANSNYALYVRDDGNVGIGTINPSYKLQIENATTGVYKTVAFVKNTDGTDNGSSAIFGYLVPSSAGGGWGRAVSKAAIKGFTYIGESYTAGVAGYRTNNDYPYSAGVFGASSTNITPTAWGALGYKGYQNGSLYDYAGFFNGDVAVTGNIMLEDQYLNFDTIIGYDGYGMRDREGTIEFKNFGGTWNPMPLPPPSGASTEWWYKPSGKNWIQPISNSNIKVFDAGQDTGFYYNGSTNKIAGFFKTSSGKDGTTAVQGFSAVAGKSTYGYLGYNGIYSAYLYPPPNGNFTVEGAAVYGVVNDPDRVSIFGRTTGDASYAAIIGYSDAWISGYFSAKDSSGTTYGGRPALYGQLLTKANKDVGEFQTAIQGYSEFTGNGNTGYTIGGVFTAYGNYQNVVGANIYSNTDGSLNAAQNIGLNVLAEGGDVIYGAQILAGSSTSTGDSYGLWSEALTTVGTGIIGAGNNASATTLTVGSGGAFNGKKVGIYSTNLPSLTVGTNYSWYDVSTAAVIGDAPPAGRIGATSMYQFGVVGQKGQESSGYDYRSGGILGVNYNETTSIIDSWGAVGYKSFTGNNYGLYSSIAGGTKNNIASGVGVAGNGDLFGAWFKGDVYGLAVKGDRMSLYVDGRTFTNDIITQVTEVNNKVVTTYVPTSTTADIYIKGVGKLVNGKTMIKFSDDYLNLISETEPIIVTVTPLGKCNGIYLDEVKSSGFTVVEQGDGKSSIDFNYIAIATRKGYEKIENPKEIVSPNFDNNLDNFMTNESNETKNAQPLWWDGKDLQTSEIPISTEINTNKNKLIDKVTEHKKMSKKLEITKKQNPEKK